MTNAFCVLSVFIALFYPILGEYLCILYIRFVFLSYSTEINCMLIVTSRKTNYFSTSMQGTMSNSSCTGVNEKK